MKKKEGIIGISTFVHDSSSCLVDTNGKILFASAEERYSNQKSDSHIPFFTIQKCIEVAKKNKIKITKIAIAFDPILFLGNSFSKKLSMIIKNSYNEKIFINFLKGCKPDKFFNLIFNYKYIDKFFMINNFKLSLEQKRKIYEYLTYYFNSMIKYKKVTNIIKKNFPHIEVVNVRHHLAHAVSAYFNSGFKNSNILVMDGKGEDDTITLFSANQNNIREISKTSWPISLGYLYQLATFALNYSIGDEFKVMGMSAYGKNKYLKYIEECFKINSKGEIIFSSNDYLKIKDYPNTKYEQLFFTKKFINKVGKVNSQKFTQNHYDLAKSVQTIVEKLGLQLANYVYKKIKSPNLCISGGCALNGLMNNHILLKSKYKDIYVFAASGDDGTAVGAAQYLLMENNKFSIRKKITKVFLGYEDNQISNKSYIQENLPNNMQIIKVTNTYKFIAQKISNNKILAIFNGKSEFGPRALGNRSIVANALNPNIKRDLNLKIKLREPFRPFAPIVLRSDAKKYFKLKIDSEFMLFICDTVKKYRKSMPGVVHEDNTARVQTVDKDNKIFYKILKEFKKINKTPILINTSFNLGGEAVVNNISDAINSFNQMNIDYLLIGNFIIEKKYDVPKKKIVEFISNRRKNFDKINPYPRIDLIRLNYNYYTNIKKILKKKVKDILKTKIRKGFFI
mgnify:FL=1